jgi:hypothetical protein
MNNEEQNGTQPVLVLLTVSLETQFLCMRRLHFFFKLILYSTHDSPFQTPINIILHLLSYPISQESSTRNGLLDRHHGNAAARDFSKTHPNNPMNSHGSDVSASCVLQTGSEPSVSNRTSLETTSIPSFATATMASSRKSVSFEERRLTPSTSREDFKLAQSSPFSSYANLGGFDDCRRASDEGFISKGSRHHNHAETEEQCMLGMDSQATSAPMGTLDAVSVNASTAERLRAFINTSSNNNNNNNNQQAPMTAAQRLKNQTSSQLNNAGSISSVERKSSLPLSTGSSAREEKDSLEQQLLVSSPPPPAPSPDLLRDFGEAYGAHLVSPRHSIDQSSSSLSNASSLAHLHQQHSTRSSIGGSSSGGVHHSISNNSVAATNRSSLDVLLGASAGSTPSRNSLDSLQDLLAAVGGVGVGRASWESLGGTPRSSAVPTTSGFNIGGGRQHGLGGSKSAHRLSAAGHLEKARLAMTTSAGSSLSLDPLTEKNLIDEALLGTRKTTSAAIIDHGYPSSGGIRSPSALRALADSSMSVTVVAAPTKRSAPTAAGPSVGAMASGLIDHYVPTTTGESSTPPRHGAGTLGGGSASLSGAATTSYSPPRATIATRTQPQGYMPSGHIAPPALLDADLHDTFGAHAWYCGPAVVPNNKNRSSNSRRDDFGGSGSGGFNYYNSSKSSGTTAGISSGGYGSTSNTTSSTMALDGSRTLHDGNNGNFRDGNATTTPSGSSSIHRSGVLGNGKQFSGGLAAAVAADDSSSAFSAAGTVSAGQQQQQQRHLGGNRGTAKHLELTSMPGQHSVTLHDAQCIVPSYDFLRQRRLAKAQQAKEGAEYWSGGYIAEAKRVLNEAMGSASRQEAENRDSSYSGAIGPLLRHLNAAAGDNEKSRSALHTLGLLVSNLPNRGIIAELQGRHTLAAVLRLCTDLDVREQAVTLLWDLDSAAGKDAAPAFIAEDLFALIQLLEDTQHAAVASSALHFLDAAIELPSEVGERVELTPDQLAEMSTRVVTEVCAHKHRLQDAAQYTLGVLLGSILNDPLMTPQAVSEALESLLTAVQICKDPDQCQVLLTVLSSLAGKPRLLSLMCSTGTRARDAVLQCGQNANDQRVRARSLSLIKVLRSKDELPTAAALSSLWYFGPADDVET